MNQFNELKQLVESLTADADKFYDKGNKAAGVRLRKGLQSIKTTAQDIRKDVSERKNAVTA